MWIRYFTSSFPSRKFSRLVSQRTKGNNQRTGKARWGSFNGFENNDFVSMIWKGRCHFISWQSVSFWRKYPIWYWPKELYLVKIMFRTRLSCFSPLVSTHPHPHPPPCSPHTHKWKKVIQHLLFLHNCLWKEHYLVSFLT